MRYLAIDHGEKRTGLAISDASEAVVSPYAVIETANQQELVRRIAEVVRTEQVETVVIGLPFNMDDTEGPRAKKVRQFALTLQTQSHCPVILHDERLSSFEADYLSQDLNLTRKKKKKRLDAIAASAILRSFFEHKKEDRGHFKST